MSLSGKENVVAKALTLIGKLQHKYGFKPKFYNFVEFTTETEELPTIIEEESAKEDPPPDTEEGDWCLVSSHGNRHKLPKTMIFLGREECDIEVQSSTVDKRHAVVTFDHYLRRFKIKDLSTANGTFVNKNRIPEQEYVILEQRDTVNLGQDDSIAFQMEKIEDIPRNDQEGEEIYQQIEDELPPWANRDTGSQDLQSPMAECQGCIVEQRIEHTCGESIPESDSAHKDLDRSYSHDSIASFGLGCNTWPKKRYKPKKSVKEIFAAMDEERSLHIEGLIDTPPSRVLRGTGAPMNKLPDELETVKKGTPLYGQPEWWGEEESDLNIDKMIGKVRAAFRKKLRSNGSSMDQESSKASVTSEESRTSVSTSADKHSDHDATLTNNNVPKTEDSTVPITQPKTPEGITNMAFTVDFGDESKHQLEGKSIGDFMPSRLRKSFRERKEKTSEKLSTPSKSSSKEKIPQEKSTTNSTNKVVGRAVSEGRDISPTHQHKIDELWNTSATPESASNKRLKMLSKSSSSRSMDDDHSESSFSKGTKSSAVKRRVPASNSSQSKPKSVIRARKAVSQEILASSTQYNNEKASYLIDKMFQNNSTGSVDSLRTKVSGASGTEYEMYHEAIKYDTDRSRKTQSQDLTQSAKVEKIRSKEVPVSVLRKSNEEVTPKKEEDKVSEAGTYTIEEEQDGKEEDEARKNIEKVFGLDDVSVNGSGSVNLDLSEKCGKSDKQGDLTLNLQHLNLELEEIEKLEKLQAQPKMADSMEAELGSAESRGYNDENPTVPGDAPKWVSQWAALTNQKSQNKSDMDLSSPGSSISDDSKSSGRAHNGISRKRPGTGRKLPTIPPEASSPTPSDRSITKESPMSSKSDLTINGTASVLQSPPQRAVKISSRVSARYEDTDSESISLTKYGSEVENTADMSSRSNYSRNGSVASLDTEVLLRDTQTVMTAMEERMGSKPQTSQLSDLNEFETKNFFQETENGLSDENSYTQSTVRYSVDRNESLIIDDSVDFESDTSSVVALVNGDEDFVKPSLYKSPREVLGNKSKLKLSESLPSKPSVKMSGAKSRTVGHEKERKHSVEEKTVVSDTFSDVNGDLTIRTEDLESEAGQFNRQGSKGKGTMSMTRPNRAFALRRARADGDESQDSSRSTASTVSIASSGFRTPRGGGSMTNLTKSSTPQKPRRPMSGVLSDRQAPPDSSRSHASLGTKIVQKSRENLNNSFAREDGGRHSLRVARSMSIPVQQTTPGKSRKSEGSSALHHSKSLRVTGVSAKERSGSVTRPGHRNNSPKSAERNAWKRRKEYDPRKAVADAKTKHKDTKRKSDGSEIYNKARGVTRSASFTNSKDLKLSSYQCDSTSSTDDYSRRSSATSDVFDDGPRRGFVPYSARSLLSSKVSNSSADDDDFDRSVRSSSTQSTQAISKSRHNRSTTHPSNYSAFTPPPRNPLPLSVYKPAPRSRSSTRSSRAKIALKTPSPTPPTSVTMATERRSVDSLKLHENALGHKNTAKVETTPRIPENELLKNHIGTSQYGFPQNRIIVLQSYDTLIVSSIYQLSQKLKSQTDKTMDKLRDSDVIENGLDSPLDELENQSAVSEIPAYKSANQELAGVLKNLRKLEQHLKIMNKVLFPDDDGSPDTSREKHEYMQEIERIKNELAGFQPIETPRDDVWKQSETASVESDCEELSHSEYY
ncbi:centrosomal protein of 170 kDa protein B-like isoform X3 [Ruditapes philippinarum]|uniref:centrosomal protein of 170 kDa protein B-like isoform X3 n=1 Tax=Ruditapes philippinarum TaxID=129788 RepID=UPI00295B60F6|nr:centrosomal protein of 170 kDa protein B-like isoform X3 [Ruditapes philippinarum]